MTSTRVETPRIKKVYGGLSWPEKGFPAFLCVAGETLKKQEDSFDPPPDGIEVILEASSNTLIGLQQYLDTLQRLHCKRLYAIMEPRFASFHRDLTLWKRNVYPDLRILKTDASSFEFGVLKIRELLNDKRLSIPFNSKIRQQLSVFAKENINENAAFYAVKALSLVIGAFERPRGDATAQEDPKLRSWW